MPEIVTDHEVLRRKSEPANDLEIGDLIQQLSISIPAHALGLAAPQIGIHKRIFLANLSSGSFAFINPEITWTSPDKIPSEESCLSLPGINRCVERHSQATVSCYKLIDMKTGDVVFDPEPMRLKNRDSFIVQHENDHLNGVLIINLPLVMTVEAKRLAKEENRKKRIQKSRLNKPPPKPPKMSTSNLIKKKRKAKKTKREQRTAKRQDKIRVEIQERFNAEKKGLFSKSESSTSDAANEVKQD